MNASSVSRHISVLLFCSGPLSLLSGLAIAAEPLAPKTFASTRVPASSSPIIDGRLDDLAWQQAPVIDDLHQFQPNENAPATERSEFYVLYDDDYLYVGARLLDTKPDEIGAKVLRQGERLSNDDKIAVILDTFNDKRNGYRFEVNPNGIRDDALFLDTSQLQWDWEGIYLAEATRTPDGWTAEIAIPFKTLSFDPASDTWGINFHRFIARNNERIGWVSRNRSQDPSSSGVMTGMTGMQQGIGLDLVPGVRFREDKRHAEGTSEFRTEPSLDIYYKITPGLNGALTFNTDFSATEVDERQVNLTRFNLFFPEKRSFFLRDSDIFEFGRLKGYNAAQGINPVFSRPGLENGRPFFSRSIGLSGNGQPVDLIGGGKLSGRVGGLNVGVLAIRQDETPTVDSRTLLVGRAVANVLTESSLGLIATHGDPRSNLDSTLVGADFRYANSRFAGRTALEGELWYQQSDTEGIDGDDAAWGMRIRTPNNTGWHAGLGMKELDDNFYPAMGYVNRRGIRDYTGQFGYTRRYRSGFLQSVHSAVEHQRFDRLDDDSLQSSVTNFRLLEFANRRNDQLKFRYYRSEEVLRTPFEISRGVFVPGGDYEFDEYEVDVQFTGLRPLSGTLNWRSGDFYSGERWKMSGKLLWQSSPYFWLTGGFEYNDVELPQGDFIVRLVSARSDVMFSRAWSWVTLIQYDNVSDSVAAHSRVGWIPQAGREMFVVYNHNLLDENEDGSFRSQRADGTLKLGYTLRF